MEGAIVSSSPVLNEKIEVSIDYICSELKLDQSIKFGCIELARMLGLIAGGDSGTHDIPDSVANALACSLVSLAHQELWRSRRVTRHLPDRVIGKLYGLSSSAVVYNKRLINSEIEKKRAAKKTLPSVTKSLR